MKTTAIAALLLLAACSIPTRTAYNADHSKSWMCVPNTKFQAVPLRGEPALSLIETPEGAKVAAK